MLTFEPPGQRGDRPVGGGRRPLPVSGSRSPAVTVRLPASIPPLSRRAGPRDQGRRSRAGRFPLAGAAPDAARKGPSPLVHEHAMIEDGAGRAHLCPTRRRAPWPIHGTCGSRSSSSSSGRSDELLDASRQLAHAISHEAHSGSSRRRASDLERVVDDVFDFAERVVKGQRKMVNDVVKAINDEQTPGRRGRSQGDRAGVQAVPGQEAGRRQEGGQEGPGQEEGRGQEGPGQEEGRPRRPRPGAERSGGRGGPVGAQPARRWPRAGVGLPRPPPAWPPPDRPPGRRPAECRRPGPQRRSR